ncbi:unnamed protein product [Lampetra fluviatilis]
MDIGWVIAIPRIHRGCGKPSTSGFEPVEHYVAETCLETRIRNHGEDIRTFAEDLLDLAQLAHPDYDVRSVWGIVRARFLRYIWATEWWKDEEVVTNIQQEQETLHQDVGTFGWDVGVFRRDVGAFSMMHGFSNAVSVR